MLRRQQQDAQVLLRRPPRLLLTQPVVGQAEAAGREQVRPVAVVGERPRLAYQPVDHVPVLDPLLAPTAQPRQPLHAPLCVPDLDPLRVHPRLHPLPDQASRHRVGVALDVDRAAPVHPHAPVLVRLQAPARQPPQPGPLLRQTLLPVGIELFEQLLQEALVFRPTAEVPAAPQQQRLLQGSLELPVALLAVAVLVGLPRLNRLTFQAVVTQQRSVTLREQRPFRPGRHRRGQPVRTMHRRHPAQPPQGVLQPLAQTLVALGEAERPRLPVRVRQHEVVEQVLEHDTADRHPQRGAVGEVAGTQPARVMHLGEEHFPGRPVQGPPLLDPPLERPHLPVGEATGVAALQVGEQGPGLQPRIELQQRLQFGPDLDEGIRAGTPVTLHALDLTGQLAEATVLARRLGGHAGP